MKITRTNVTLNNVEIGHMDSRVLAFVEATLDDSLVITGIRVVQGKSRIFVAMPSVEQSKKVDESGRTTILWHDVVFPIRKDTRHYFEDVIIKAYEKAVAEAKEKDTVE